MDVRPDLSRCRRTSNPQSNRLARPRRAVSGTRHHALAQHALQPADVSLDVRDAARAGQLAGLRGASAQGSLLLSQWRAARAMRGLRIAASASAPSSPAAATAKANRGLSKGSERRTSRVSACNRSRPRRASDSARRKCPLSPRTSVGEPALGNERLDSPVERAARDGPAGGRGGQQRIKVGGQDGGEDREPLVHCLSMCARTPGGHRGVSRLGVLERLIREPRPGIFAFENVPKKVWPDPPAGRVAISGQAGEPGFARPNSPRAGGSFKPWPKALPWFAPGAARL